MKKYLTLLLLTIFIVGCSANNNTKKKDGYKHELGTTKIVDNPKVVTDFYVGELQYLDVNLIGANLNIASRTWDTKGLKNVGDSIEKIAELKPDLIITINKDKYEKLANIAPTIYMPYGKMNPDDTFKEFGKMFNKSDKVNQWITNFDKKAADLKAKIKDQSKTYSIVELSGNDIWVYGNNWGRGGFIIYDKLGFKAPGVVQNQLVGKNMETNYLNISLEKIDDYFGDNIILTTVSKNSKTYTNDVFRDVIKSRNIISIEHEDFYHVDPYSLDKQLTIFEDVLLNEK